MTGRLLFHSREHPLLRVAMDHIRDAWGPIVPVVVDRPVANVMASLNRLGWWKDEQERAESTAHHRTTGSSRVTDTTNPDPVAELQQRAAAAGLQTASLDEVLCITAVSLNQPS